MEQWLEVLHICGTHLWPCSFLITADFGLDRREPYRTWTHHLRRRMNANLNGQGVTELVRHQKCVQTVMGPLIIYLFIIRHCGIKCHLTIINSLMNHTVSTFTTDSYFPVLHSVVECSDHLSDSVLFKSDWVWLLKLHTENKVLFCGLGPLNNFTKYFLVAGGDANQHGFVKKLYRLTGCRV